MIEHHINQLPKHKVVVKVAPYKMGAQMHHPSSNQHVLSVQLHGDTKKKMGKNTNEAWNKIKDSQHLFQGVGGGPSDVPIDHDQVGWARVDANAKPGHWHIDEIQSDFQNKDKIKQRKETNADANANELHEHLSHGHDDPQHMIHSAVNELARKYNVGSTSMDTPEDQAKQSNLREFEGEPESTGEIDEAAFTHDTNDYVDNKFSEENVGKEIAEHPNQYLQSAYGKISHDDLATALQDALGGSEPTEAIRDHLSDIKGFDKLSVPEKDALRDYMTTHAGNGPYWGNYMKTVEPNKDKEREKAKLPVHQMDTYDKRPKKLGMKLADKAKVLGEENSSPDEKVQYAKLHKKLEIIRDLMKECNRE
jgi:hypothetical protein